MFSQLALQFQLLFQFGSRSSLPSADPGVDSVISSFTLHAFSPRSRKCLFSRISTLAERPKTSEGNIEGKKIFSNSHKTPLSPQIAPDAPICTFLFAIRNHRAQSGCFFLFFSAFVSRRGGTTDPKRECKTTTL